VSFVGGIILSSQGGDIFLHFAQAKQHVGHLVSDTP
jgi:hypothetical protein